MIGKTWDGALATLDEAGFTIGDGGTVEVTDPNQDGLVQSQDPGSGVYLAPGTAVRVVVGVYIPPPTTTLPPRYDGAASVYDPATGRGLIATAQRRHPRAVVSC